MTNPTQKGGRIDYNGDSRDVLTKINQATVNFARNNKDPKAAVITTYNAARFPSRWVSPFTL